MVPVGILVILLIPLLVHHNSETLDNLKWGLRKKSLKLHCIIISNYIKIGVSYLSELLSIPDQISKNLAIRSSFICRILFQTQTIMNLVKVTRVVYIWSKILEWWGISHDFSQAEKTMTVAKVFGICQKIIFFPAWEKSCELSQNSRILNQI